MGKDYSTMTVDQFEELRSLLLDRIAAVPAFRRGSLQVGYRKCGRANCRCARPGEQGHGPRGLWTRTVKGPGWLARAVHPGRAGRPGPRRAGQLRPVRRAGRGLHRDQRGAVHGPGGATGAPTPAPRRRADPRGRRGKRGLDADRPDEQEALSALADRVAELAAQEARRLVATAAALLQPGDEHDEQPGAEHGGQHGAVGVLEAIERAAQAAAAQIGLAALAGVVDWAGAGTPARADCPDRRAMSCRAAGGPAHQDDPHPAGHHPTRRGYYHCATCRQGFAPLDERLGVAATSLSPGSGPGLRPGRRRDALRQGL